MKKTTSVAPRENGNAGARDSRAAQGEHTRRAVWREESEAQTSSLFSDVAYAGFSPSYLSLLVPLLL